MKMAISQERVNEIGSIFFHNNLCMKLFHFFLRQIIYPFNFTKCSKNMKPTLSHGLSNGFSLHLCQNDACMEFLMWRQESGVT